jgi:hypothetical protein
VLHVKTREKNWKNGPTEWNRMREVKTCLTNLELYMSMLGNCGKLNIENKELYVYLLIK